MVSRGLLRRDPMLQDLFEFRRNFDDIFQRFFPQQFGEWGEKERMMAWMPPVEIFVEKDKIHARVALPAVRLEDVTLQVHQNQLTISGERKREREVKDEQFLQRELNYGRFERTIPLPEGVVPDKVEATYHDGILEITAPLSEKGLLRKIEIKQLEPGKKLAA